MASVFTSVKDGTPPAAGSTPPPPVKAGPLSGGPSPTTVGPPSKAAALISLARPKTTKRGVASRFESFPNPFIVKPVAAKSFVLLNAGRQVR